MTRPCSPQPCLTCGNLVVPTDQAWQHVAPPVLNMFTGALATFHGAEPTVGTVPDAPQWLPAVPEVTS